MNEKYKKQYSKLTYNGTIGQNVADNTRKRAYTLPIWPTKTTTVATTYNVSSHEMDPLTTYNVSHEMDPLTVR